jgi:hypothetical protein
VIREQRRKALFSFSGKRKQPLLGKAAQKFLLCWAMGWVGGAARGPDS